MKDATKQNLSLYLVLLVLGFLSYGWILVPAYRFLVSYFN